MDEPAEPEKRISAHTVQILLSGLMANLGIDISKN